MRKIILLLLFLPIVNAIPHTLDFQFTLRDSTNNLQSITDNVNITIQRHDGTLLYSDKQAVVFDVGIGYMTLKDVNLPFNETYKVNVSGDTVGELGAFNYSSVSTAYIAQNVSAKGVIADSNLNLRGYNLSSLRIDVNYINSTHINVSTLNVTEKMVIGDGTGITYIDFGTGDLYVGDDAEFDDNVWFGNTVYSKATNTFNVDRGDGQHSQIFDGRNWYFIDDTYRDQLMILTDSDHMTSFIIGYEDMYLKDYDVIDSSHPTLYVFSETDPDTDNTQWVSLTHDTYNALLYAGKGDIRTNVSLNVSHNITAQRLCFNNQYGQFLGCGNLTTFLDATDNTTLVNYIKATNTTQNTFWDENNDTVTTYIDENDDYNPQANSTEHITGAINESDIKPRFVNVTTNLSVEENLEIKGRGRFLATTEKPPSTGRGLETFYHSSLDEAYILSYDRGSTTYYPLRIGGNPTIFAAGNVMIETGLNITGDTHIMGGITNLSTDVYINGTLYMDEKNITGVDEIFANSQCFALHNSANQLNLVHAAFTQMALGTERVDDLKICDANGNCTIPSTYAGTWIIGASVRAQELDDHTTFQIRLSNKIYTSIEAFGEGRASTSSHETRTQSISEVRELSTGDVLGLWFYHTNGDNTVDALASFTTMWGCYIG